MTSKEYEQQLKEQGYSLHTRSTRPLSSKQQQLLASLRAREAVERGEGTPATHRGHQGHLVGSWFVYKSGFVKFICR